MVADQGIVTSRSPADLEPFVNKIVEEIEEGRHQRRAALIGRPWLNGDKLAFRKMLRLSRGGAFCAFREGRSPETDLLFAARPSARTWTMPG